MKTTTAARAVTVALAAVVAGTLTGCGVSFDDASNKPTDSQEAQSAGDASGPSLPGAPARPSTTKPPAAEPPESDSLTEADLRDMLTPPGATVDSHMTGMLSLSSTDSVEDLVAFYEDALARLGAQGEMGSSGVLSGMWAYNGTYDNGQGNIYIMITNINRTRQIMITY